NSAGAPAASAAATRSSPSATNRPSRSRCLRSASLRISFSLSLSLLVIIGRSATKRAPRGAPGEVRCGGGSGRRGLPGLLGKSAKRLGVAHGDVGQQLAVDLHPGLVEAVDQLRVAHALAPCGRVDADDPEPPHLALAAPAVAGEVVCARR